MLGKSIGCPPHIRFPGSGTQTTPSCPKQISTSSKKRMKASEWPVGVSSVAATQTVNVATAPALNGAMRMLSRPPNSRSYTLPFVDRFGSIGRPRAAAG